MIRLNGIGCRSLFTFPYNTPVLVEVPHEDIKDIEERPTYFTIGNLPIIYPKLFFSLVDKGLISRVNLTVGTGGFNYCSHMGVI